jgi:Na+/phosphate symporter
MRHLAYTVEDGIRLSRGHKLTRYEKDENMSTSAARLTQYARNTYSVEQLNAQIAHFNFMLSDLELDARHKRHVMERLTVCIQLLEEAK